MIFSMIIKYFVDVEMKNMYSNAGIFKIFQQNCSYFKSAIKWVEIPGKKFQIKSQVNTSVVNKLASKFSEFCNKFKQFYPVDLCKLIQKINISLNISFKLPIIYTMCSLQLNCIQNNTVALNNRTTLFSKCWR